ncbi:Uncharacterised protein [Mycobacterium tuberculosis]|nr:Uncharacterised protein [Mycobacterium tuberculosis]
MKFTNFFIQQEDLIMAKVALLNQVTRLDKEFCNLNKVLTRSVEPF